MADEVEIEAMIVALVTDKLRELVRESAQSWVPELVAKRVQEELERIKDEEVAVGKVESEPPAGFDQQIRDLFAPQIYEIAQRIARQRVAVELPEVAERLILAELAQL